jgi:hypothetical protein
MKKVSTSSSGTTYVVAPDGTVHRVTSKKDVARLAEAYRDYTKR